MTMKRLFVCITVLVLFTSLFLGCSSGADSNGKSPVVTISYDEEKSQDNDNLVLNITFENFNTSPDKVDIYIGNSENPYKAGISVQNGKITFTKPNIYIETFYVKANNVESNHIDIDFVYSVDVDSLSEFINSIPDGYIVKLQVTGKYNSLMNQIELFRNESKRIELDLSRIENALPYLSNYGFSKCVSLSKIILPEEVTSIGSYSFEYCKNLKTIVLSKGLSAINQFAFSNCISLTYIKLPSSLTTIETNAFWNCNCLESISIPDNVITLGQNIFAGCTSLSNVKLPETLTSIGYGWFHNCISLEKIEIPDNVTSIEGDVFYGCCNLSSITISDNVTSIGNSAFRECCNLSSITIPDNVISVGPYAFRGCTKLTNINIPKNVIKIGSHAFQECTNLKDVVFQVSQNWKVKWGDTLYYIDEAELQDSINAAILLRENYTNFEWTRN